MKSQIINELTGSGYTKADADKALSDVTAAIKTVAERDGSARVPEFGTFKMSDRPARTGRNPRTGEPVDIPARTLMTFKASKA